MRFRARHRTMLLLLLLLTMLATGDRGIAASMDAQRGALITGGAVMRASRPVVAALVERAGEAERLAPAALRR